MMLSQAVIGIERSYRKIMDGVRLSNPSWHDYAACMVWCLEEALSEQRPVSRDQHKRIVGELAEQLMQNGYPLRATVRKYAHYFHEENATRYADYFSLITVQESSRPRCRLRTRYSMR